MMRSQGIIYYPKGSGRQRHPEQSTRQRERASRYENHRNPLTGHITHGLKPGYARGLQEKA